MIAPEVTVGQEWASLAARVRIIKIAGSSVVVSDVRHDGGLSRTRSLLLSSLRKGYRVVGCAAAITAPDARGPSGERP